MGSLRHNKYFSGFDPRNISGCYIWSDADTLSALANGTTVNSWTNLGSGGTVTATGTVSNAVLNGRTVVNFTTSQTWTTGTTVNLSSYSLFAVCRQTGGTNGRVFQSTTNNQLYGYWWGYKKSLFTDSSPGQLTTATSDTSWDLMSHTRVAGGAYTFNWYGSNTFSGGTSTANNMTGLAINTGTYTGETSACQVAEIILYSRVLSSIEVQQVEGYLAWKWGLMSPIQSPLSISGCALWLDAADQASLTLSGSNVTQWRDKSGNGRNATGGVSPSYSDNGVVFNGTTTYLTTTYSAVPSAESVFVVVTWTGSANRDYNIIGTSATNGRNYNVLKTTGSNTIKWDRWGVAGYAETSGVQSNVRFLSAGVFNGTSGSTNLNGGSQTGLASFSFSGTGLTNIGASIITDYYQGTINEIICYNSSLSVSDRQRVEGYLADKWGLRGNLPGTFPATIPLTHPFYRSLPYTRAFSPLDIPGAILWLDAADSSVFNGGATWTDKSGTGNHGINGTPGASSMPTLTSWTNGLPAARFTATSKSSVKTTNFIPNVNVTYFIVFRTHTFVAGISRIMINNVDGHRQLYISGNSAFPVSVTAWANYNSPQVPISSLGQNVPVLYAAGLSSGGFNTYTDGSYRAGSGTATSSASRHYFGSGDGDGSYSSIDIGEILIYNTVLSDVLRQQVEGYLAWKWATSTNLPSSHYSTKIPPRIPVFTPPQISGLALWLDAADPSTLVLSGTNVSQWNDKSGVANHAIRGTTALGPTVTSANTLLFTRTSNSAQLLRTQYGKQTTQNVTFFLVVKSYNDNDGSIFDHRKAVNVQALHTIGSRGLTLRGTSSALITYNYVLPSTFSVVCLQSQSNLARLFVNGTLITTQTGAFDMPAADAGFITIGSLTDVPYQYWSYYNQYTYGATTEMGEIMMYNAYLSDAERQQVEGYLANKWGLRSSLPSTHPYIKNTP